MKTVALQSELDQTLVALADPTRRAILQRLSEGEARVTELPGSRVQAIFDRD